MKRLLLTLSLAGFAAMAQAETFKAPEDLSTIKPQLLCVHYTEQTESEKKRFYDRLDKLNLLSHKDYEMMQTGQVVPGSSICGMYMTKGKPLKEEGMQIRPMVFKVVHIYEDQYIVTQSGLVMETHKREPGVMPPSINQAVPKVAPPPLAPQH